MRFDPLLRTFLKRGVCLCVCVYVFVVGLGNRALRHARRCLCARADTEDLLKRDSRVVERKKAGQKKARKKFQWVKR